MGLERIAAVLQGKHNNYDIDLFRTLIEAVAHETGVDPDGPQSASHKVIADHLRTTAFLIADGVLPSNEGRGYVLRRIMRRAMRHAHILGAQDPMIFKLVPSLVHEMGDAYPELVRAQPLITETLKLEEGRFKKTLGTGLKLLEDETKGLERRRHAQGRRRLQALRHLRLPARPDAGRAARARHRGRYRGLREGDGRAARQGARGWAGSGETADQAIWFDVRQKVGATEFLGYDTERAEGQVKAIVVDGKEVAVAEGGPDRLDRRPTRRRSMPNPAARSATPAGSSAPMARPRSSTCRSASATCMPITPGSRRASSRSATISP